MNILKYNIFNRPPPNTLEKVFEVLKKYMMS